MEHLIEKFINALYNLLLARESDTKGLKYWSNVFTAHSNNWDNYIITFINSYEREGLLKSSPHYYPKVPSLNATEITGIMHNHGCDNNLISYITNEYYYSLKNSNPSLLNRIDTIFCTQYLTPYTAKRVIFLNNQSLLPTAPNESENYTLDRIKFLISKIRDKNKGLPLYQPLWIDSNKINEHSERECKIRCKLILESIQDLQLSSMTCIDVGCNAGYVTFFFSEYFNTITGVEFDNTYYEICTILKQMNFSRAKFEFDDFFVNYKNYLNKYDVLMMLSVIHYLYMKSDFDTATNILNSIIMAFLML